MSDYVTLLGAEQVQSAGQRMTSAADDMQRAALTFENAAERLARVMEDACIRMTEAAERIERAMASTAPTGEAK